MLTTLPWFGLIARVFVGGFFVYAAVPKIIEPLAFATSISLYGMMPSWSVNAYALVIPWLELLVGVCLVVGYKVKTSSALAGIMLLMFTAAVAWAVINGLSIDCGCFGAEGGEQVGWLKVAQNLGMTALCIYLWLHPSTAISMEHGLKGRS